MTHEIRPLFPVPKLSNERQKELYEELMNPKPKSVSNIQEGFYKRWTAFPASRAKAQHNQER